MGRTLDIVAKEATPEPVPIDIAECLESTNSGGIEGAAAAGKRDHAAHGLQGILKKNHLPVVQDLARHYLDGHRQVEDRCVGLGGGGGGIGLVVRRGAAGHGDLGQRHRLFASCQRRCEQ